MAKTTKWAEADALVRKGVSVKEAAKKARISAAYYYSCRSRKAKEVKTDVETFSNELSETVERNSFVKLDFISELVVQSKLSDTTKVNVIKEMFS